MKLPNVTAVYPEDGEKKTIGKEQRENRFV